MPTRNPANAVESVVERVYFAVRALATEQGDVRARLCIAGAILHKLQANEFPPQLRAEFSSVIKQLTRHQGRIETTMKRIQNSTGKKLAICIFDIYAKLQEIRGRPLL